MNIQKKKRKEEPFILRAAVFKVNTTSILVKWKKKKKLQHDLDEVKLTSYFCKHKSGNADDNM